MDEKGPDDPANTPATDVTAPANGEELDVLLLEQGVNVWGQDQQVLEDQALQEINIFSQGAASLEDGEIQDDEEAETEEEVKGAKQGAVAALDIDSYIKRQEQLKQIRTYRKTLQVPDKSKEIADRISKAQKKRAAAKKRKISESVHTAPEATSSKPAKVICIPAKEAEPADQSGSEYVPSEEDSDYEPDAGVSKEGRVSSPGQKCAPRKKSTGSLEKVKKVQDDGCEALFKSRLEAYYSDLEAAKNECAADEEDEEEVEFYTIKKGLKIPLKIWENLYVYQQDGVRWLWQLHQKSTGGLLGDEMGLGKTVQVIAFLAGLEYTQVFSCGDRFRGMGPTLIVCPATVVHQWVKHFHDWAPEFRVAILHQSGSFQGNKVKLIREMHKAKGVIVTTYSGVLKHKGDLVEHNWHYVILDEGHKIRNHNAKVSKAVKEIRTPHRLMLTGSPMQNNLQELWSLFDFTNPGMLGSLNTFMEHFNNPIVQGGFANATDLQEATALSVATTLKNIITPFLLRRSKNEVQGHICLPNKSEQVLFCTLTDEQRELYKGYLMGDHVGMVLDRDTKRRFSDNQMRAKILVGIMTLRKICNHPDIYLSEGDDGDEAMDDDDGERDGFYKRSGKMVVVSALLKIWKRQKHRVLLFTQGRAMIGIFEEFLQRQGYRYLKMDGGTAVGSRQPLINKFNEDDSYDVFLLTTRVGGLGVNLTGADRVIIYDPDWNPATDTQARERAWRIGQDKQVTIYRLLSAGTIEEKMYQRQVWKQLLSNKVLLDPRTRRFFNSSSLHDLFSMPDSVQASNPETANIFRDSRVQIQERIHEEQQQQRHKKRAKKAKRREGEGEEKVSVEFSEDKIQAMRMRAHQISQSMSKKEAVVEPKKTSFQLEIEEERRRKLEEKKKLKKLSAMEIVNWNRERLKAKNEDPVNKIDDLQSSVSFSKALEYTEVTAKIYTDLRAEKLKNYEKEEAVARHKRKHEEVLKSVVDETGTIDGEKVEGLVKTETKKPRKKHKEHTEVSGTAAAAAVAGDSPATQDDYVLGKLFARKGVSGALQHESIVEGGVKTQSLRVQAEATERADRAMEALRKSRLSSWRW